MKSIKINYLDSNRRGMRFTGCLMGKDLMMEISSFKVFFNDETKLKRLKLGDLANTFERFYSYLEKVSDVLSLEDYISVDRGSKGQAFFVITGTDLKPNSFHVIPLDERFIHPMVYDITWAFIDEINARYNNRN